MIRIISPHLDDAVLSMGGTMKKILNGNTGGIEVDYIFDRSNWINPDAIEKTDLGADIHSVSNARQKEEEAVSRELGYTYRLFGLADKVARELEINSPDDATIREQVSARLHSDLDKAGSCFFPLGLGHKDHNMMREIGMQLLEEKYDIIFYEDLPYAALSDYDFQERYEFISRSGALPVTIEVDITSKLKACKLYESQVSYDWLAGIRSYAYSLKDNKFCERFWVPHNVDQNVFFGFNGSQHSQP